MPNRHPAESGGRYGVCPATRRAGHATFVRRASTKGRRSHAGVRGIRTVKPAFRTPVTRSQSSRGAPHRERVRQRRIVSAGRSSYICEKPRRTAAFLAKTKRTRKDASKEEDNLPARHPHKGDRLGCIAETFAGKERGRPIRRDPRCLLPANAFAEPRHDDLPRRQRLQPGARARQRATCASTIRSSARLEPLSSCSVQRFLWVTTDTSLTPSTRADVRLRPHCMLGSVTTKTSSAMR